jgi:RHS repeat-associated protein
MTNAAKAQVWNALWLPHGTAHAITGTATQNLRFPGQYFLIESGLAYNWHRFYDPTTGRYTQVDPLGFVDGPSRYAYALNSPLTKVDKDGRNILEWFWYGDKGPPPANDNIPAGMCVFTHVSNRSERRDRCTIEGQEYCNYKCHSGRTKSYPKTTKYVPCAAMLADAPPYDD